MNAIQGSRRTEILAGLGYLAAVLVILFAAGCGDDITNVLSPTEPTGTKVLVSAAGTVAVLPAGLQCADSSRCTLAGEEVVCASVDWEVVNSATGVLVASATREAGDRVQFDGLAVGDYTVTQRARASDGESDAEIYNRTITGL